MPSSDLIPQACAQQSNGGAWVQYSLSRWWCGLRARHDLTLALLGHRWKVRPVSSYVCPCCSLWEGLSCKCEKWPLLPLCSFQSLVNGNTGPDAVGKIVNCLSWVPLNIRGLCELKDLASTVPWENGWGPHTGLLTCSVLIQFPSVLWWGTTDAIVLCSYKNVRCVCVCVWD